MCPLCRVCSEVLVISIIDPPWEDQCESHRMTRVTGPDCAVMSNLINTNIHTHTHTHTHTHKQGGEHKEL